MSNYEKITTGMGEECGVFGAYDMDGGDVAPSCFAAQRTGKLWYCSDRHLRRAQSSFEEGAWPCKRSV